MPSRKKIGWVGFDWIGLLSPRRFTPPGIEAAASAALPKYRYDGFDVQQRFEKIFDPALTDLSDLKIGFFDKKAVNLPSARIPANKGDLLKFCRQLVDRGENEFHLRIMLQNLPGGWTLEQHVEALWEISASQWDLFEDLTQGFHGEAIRRFKEGAPQTLSLSHFKGVMARQALLWCAMDVQMAISAARVANTKPFGSFLVGTMKEPKGGMAINLMSRGRLVLEKILMRYQTLEEIKRDGKIRRKPKEKEAKEIGFHAENRWYLLIKRRSIRFNSVKFFRRKLDDALIYIRSQSPRFVGQIACLETYNVGNGTEPKLNNRHRTFHQIWYSDLTATVATAISLMRFSMAESEIELLIDNAFGETDGAVEPVCPLRPPPDGLDKNSPLFRRVLDLLDSARRVHLRDSNNDSRTYGQQAPDEQRDPEDFAGLTVIDKAYSFLLAVGQRDRHAYNPTSVNDDRQRTYWHLDVVPEVRLNLVRDPAPRFLG